MAEVRRRIRGEQREVLQQGEGHEKLVMMMGLGEILDAGVE